MTLSERYSCLRFGRLVFGVGGPIFGEAAGGGGVIIGILRILQQTLTVHRKDNREVNLPTVGLLYSGRIWKYKRAGEWGGGG